MSADVAASVKARLLNEAKQRGESFELFLVRYACERFLYRLGASDVRDRCTLKGAGPPTDTPAHRAPLAGRAPHRTQHPTTHPTTPRAPRTAPAAPG